MEEHEIFAEFLLNEYLRRSRLRPSFSLRAFAKFLEVDQSLLSKVISHQRKPSKKFVEQCLKRLGVPRIKWSSLTGHRGDQLFNRHRSYRVISDDVFKLVSDWAHFAVLELAKLPSFEFDAQWVAGRLGRTQQEMELVLARLAANGFFQKIRGKWKLTRHSNTWTDTASTSADRLALQIQFLGLALSAAEKVSFAQRDNGSLTLAIDVRLLPRFKERLSEIRRELGEEFQSQGELTAVYQLCTAFFPLTLEPT
jgi:hypothetical protein